MSRTVQAFQKQAEGMLHKILDSGDVSRIYGALCAEDPDFKSVPPKDFEMNYLAARLAQISLSWESECTAQGILLHEKAKAFLKRVMDTFQKPDTLSFASAFSEYRCATQILEDESSDTLAMTRLLFQRFKLNPVIEVSQEIQMMRNSFQMLMGALESERAGFENYFFEWLALDDSGEQKK